MSTTRRTFLNTMAAGLLAGRCDMWPSWKDRRNARDRYTPADELTALKHASAWLNSPALDDAAFAGKVVLVQFGTFTCINWLRTLPHVRAWFRQYHDQGLLVINVHTPEFGFEREVGNVTREMTKLDLGFPVAVDSEYRVWRGFDNHYWPALYLFDAEGRLQYRHFGEGEYPQTESMIRRLVRARGGEPGPEVSAPDGFGAEAAPDWPNIRSPENYLGAARTTGFASPGGLQHGARMYGVPQRLPLNQWALQGEWSVDGERVISMQPNSALATAFHARDLHLVMGPGPGASPVHFRVTLDGAAPGAARGFDIDEGGVGLATEQRMHQLIRQSPPIEDRTLRIEFLDRGIEAFAFTFG